MEVLYALREHKDCKRFVPSEIEKPDDDTIARLKEIIERWMNKKFGLEEDQLVKDIFDGGSTKIKQYDESIPAERYNIENYDLLIWFVVSHNNSF